MKSLIVPFLLFLAVFSSACASPEPKISLEEQEALENIPEPITPSREALYVYNAQAQVKNDRVELRINNEPLLLKDSYVRLVGVVSGGRPRALIDVGGRGVVVGCLDDFYGYSVESILSDCVWLMKKGGDHGD
ncbi:MAG: hypothetical protein ABIE84_04850 [bacterium]